MDPEIEARIARTESGEATVEDATIRTEAVSRARQGIGAAFRWGYDQGLRGRLLGELYEMLAHLGGAAGEAELDALELPRESVGEAGMPQGVGPANRAW